MTTEQHRLETEAREWKRRISEQGSNGLAWWQETKESIRTKRGDAGFEYLLTEMNRQRGK